MMFDLHPYHCFEYPLYYIVASLLGKLSPSFAPITSKYDRHNFAQLQSSLIGCLETAKASDWSTA